MDLTALDRTGLNYMGAQDVDATIVLRLTTLVHALMARSYAFHYFRLHNVIFLVLVCFALCLNDNA